MSVHHQLKDIDGKIKALWEESVPLPLFAPQIMHGLSWYWIRALAVRGRQLTMWAMALPQHILLHTTLCCHWPSQEMCA